jgi:Fe2+ or Zn2+ uptake regulation protein
MRELPAPRARVLAARLVRVTPRRVQVLVVLSRRQGGLTSRPVLLVSLDRPSGRVLALASV